jgi:hypothetical protein
MKHSEFAKFIRSKGFTVSVQSLKAFAANGDDSRFPNQLQLFLEDYQYVNGQWLLNLDD